MTALSDRLRRLADDMERSGIEAVAFVWVKGVEHSIAMPEVNIPEPDRTAMMLGLMIYQSTSMTGASAKYDG